MTGSNEHTSIIIAVSIFTLIAVGVCSQTVCSDESIISCLYLQFDSVAILKVLIGNTILFSSHLMYLGSFIFEKSFNIKVLIVVNNKQFRDL